MIWWQIFSQCVLSVEELFIQKVSKYLNLDISQDYPYQSKAKGEIRNFVLG